ncbi:MAG: hypothetical protein ACREJM_07870, partial [Candidatus Saccharimonadales bacterium]
VWLSDVTFGADPRHIDRELVPDPDRAAAEYVVATRGEGDCRAEAWVSGKTIQIRTMADIPSEQFKIVGLFYPGPTGRCAENVSDVGLKLFGQLSDCRLIALNGARITDDGLEYLKDMASLEVLSLVNAPINGSGVRHLAQLPRLTSLGIDHAPVSDEQMPYIAALPKMTHLGIAGTRVTDAGLNELECHSALTSISLDETRISDEGLQHLRDLPAGLHTISLSTTNAPRGLVALEGCPIRSVKIVADGVKGTVNDSILESLKSFPDLTSLALRNAVISINVAKQIAMVERLSALQFETHYAPSPIRDGALKQLAKMPNLNYLLIASFAPLREAQLLELAGATTLRSLNIYHVPLEAASVLKLQAALPNCKITVDPEVQQAIDALRGKK